MLELDWSAELARTMPRCSAISPVLSEDDGSLAAVQCALFEKSGEKNWLVGMHQGLSIPVAAKVESCDLHGWSNKEGIWYVQPPLALLRRMIAIRVHLDACGPDDGPLRIVPGSHKYGRLADTAIRVMRQTHGETVCCVEAGTAQVMSPLLLHASSKASGVSRRRVLHFLFGPQKLPCGLQWHKAVT